MWPWEHLAVGYLAYVAWRRLAGRGRPTDAAALTVAVATQVPDLVDKPLAWTLDVLPSGTSLGHSVLFAVPAAGLAAAWAVRRGRTDVAAALVVGYATHLAGDVLYPALLGGSLAPGKVLWPLVEQEQQVTGGLSGRFWSLFADFVAFLGTPRGQYYLGAELLLLATAAVWWTYDGAPGLRALYRAVAAR